MRKRIKKAGLTVTATLLTCGCLLVGSLVPAGASETGKTTKTWTVDTSFRTRVTAELSKATEFLGGTIEFDLLSSDLKDDYNINGICESLGDFPVGVSYHDFDAANTYAARRLNYASINFNFYKVNEDMDEFSWRVGGANAENGSNESQLSSFSYYADGRIVEYSGDAGDYTVRYQREIGPGTEGFVGTQEDIDAFMTEGYSYRVEWVWGEVSEEKEVEVKSPEEMKELGANYRQGWYVVYSKEMSAPEDAYEVLFAFRTRAVYRLQNGIADNKLGSYAGFEISANSGNPRQYNNGEYSPASHNVKMELDNVSIYEGYDYESGTKGGKSGFEGEYAGLTGLDESGIKNAGRVNSDMGAWAGDFSKAYWDIHEAQADGLRVQIANAGRECMESYATSEQTEREVCTVRFTDGEKVLSEQEVVKGFAVTLPSGKIDGYKYFWATEGIDPAHVNSDLEIVGTPVLSGEVLTAIDVGATGKIAMRFYMQLPEALRTDEGAYVRFEVAGQESFVYVKDIAPTTDGEYVFECSVAAAQMTEKVRMQLFDGNGVGGKIREYSVRDYAMALREISVDEQQTALLEAMLRYGAAAQEVFSVNTDQPADAGIPEADYAGVSFVADPGITGSCTGIESVRYELFLTSETSMRIYYNFSGESNIENYVFTVDGEEVPVVASGTGNEYFVEISDIPAAYLDRKYSIMAYNNADATSVTVETSAVCYASDVVNNPESDELKVKAMKALYLYNLAAKKFFFN